MATSRKVPVPATAAAPSAPRKAAPQKPAAPAAKPAKPAAPKPAAAAKPAPAKPVKLKAKLVRDSFTMPQADFDLVAGLKARAIAFQRPVKKSELLRAGLHVLQALDDTRLRAALDALVPLKPGRPKHPA